MATFFSSQNNGVIAVIRADHAEMWGIISSSNGDPLLNGVKIFTFCCREARMQEEPGIFTGTKEDLGWLMKGHELLEASKQPHGQPGWGGFVPFSNGMETGIHGGEAQAEELRFRTTLRDAIEVFGLRPAPHSTTKCNSHTKSLIRS